MQLALQFNPHTQRKVAAAFLPGGVPGMWLREINDWGIAVEQLTCFIVPQQLHTVQAAGLLVIFPEGMAPAADALRYAYGSVAGKLFLPVNADLTPALTLPELQQLLVWDYQLYHPAIGFVGYEAADRLPLADLLAWPAPRDTDWTYAHPGLPTMPPLEQIGILQLNSAQVVEYLQEAVGQRPLADIIPVKERNRSAADRLFYLLLLPFLMLTKAIFLLLDALVSLYRKLSRRKARPVIQPRQPATTGKSGQPGMPGKLGQPGTPGKLRQPAWVQRAEGWVNMRLDELMAKRESELQRLMKLFDTNTEEALKYAIPLDSPYMPRGEAPPSAQLGKRSTNFDLGKLGGGQAADGWDVGNYYSGLRQKYQQAAEKELAAGNYKKAAYIYAHLMGNYQSAAQALEQGQHYREAAALYKEHIKNIPAAAACLEKGGLYLEAIELYDSLQQYERAGDLYMRMEQWEQATTRYERCIEYALNHHNNLDAARIMDQKLQQPERAKQHLMQGWQNSRQATACLIRYFEMTAADATAGPLETQVRQVFEQDTPASRQVDFLEVLMAVHKQYPQPALAATAADITYEVIGKQLSEGDSSNLSLLKHFIPEDRLLPVDLQRFTASQKKQAAPLQAVSSFQLARDTRWVGAVTVGAQLLILGVKNTGIYLVRANKDGKVEYTMWSTPVSGPFHFRLVRYPYISDQAFLHTNFNYGITRDGSSERLRDKVLTQTAVFPRKVLVKCPSWLPNGLLGFGFSVVGQVFTVHTENNNNLILSCYTAEGGLSYTRDCRMAGESLHSVTAPAIAQEMIFRDDFFYLSYGEYVMRVNTEGEMQAARLKGIVVALADCTIQAAACIVAATEAGCVLLAPIRQSMNVQQRYFAVGQGIKAVYYVQDGLVVLASAKHAAVYRMKDIHDGTDEPITVINTDSAIVAVDRIFKRYHCAIVEENGRVSIHSLLNT